jgi:hypothetical protein
MKLNLCFWYLTLFLELVKVVCEMNVQLSSTVVVFDFFKIFTVCGEIK